MSEANDAMEDDIQEFYVPRQRITSYQSTDSLDKWQKNGDESEINTKDNMESGTP